MSGTLFKAKVKIVYPLTVCNLCMFLGRIVNSKQFNKLISHMGLNCAKDWRNVTGIISASFRKSVLNLRSKIRF